MFIDIHSHILPNVDDGSKDMSMSIAMAELYLENGFKKVIATPHYIKGSMDNSFKDNKVALEILNESLFKKGLDLQVLLGNEIYVSLETIDDIFSGRVSTLNNSRYILLELPMHDIPLYMDSILFELGLKGYVPIIGHPERNAKIIEDPNILYDFIENGALAQMNLPSLEGRYGSQVESTANILLEHNMIHFIGTDAHRDEGRSPDVREVLNLLKGKMSQKQFEDMTYKNAELILVDKAIEVEDPIIYEAKRGIFKFFKNRVKR